MTIKTNVVRINLDLIEQDKMGEVINVLKKGGIVVYPTDTFYGLGANGYLTEAVKKIYTLKGRDPGKPLSLVISNKTMVEDLAAEIPPIFQRVTHRFWPGPLTIVLKAGERIPTELQSPDGSIGIRWPDLPWLWELIGRAGFPLTSTSANLAGEIEISDPDSVIRMFSGKVDLVVDAGKCPGELPSTVMDLTGIKPRILREGALPTSELKRYLEKPIRD